jgi:hypothetical protein
MNVASAKLNSDAESCSWFKDQHQVDAKYTAALN